MENTVTNLEKFIEIYYKHTWIRLNNQDAVRLSTQLIVFVENILIAKQKEYD